jgi:hypothetical protein
VRQLRSIVRMPEISEQLARALDALVRASSEAERAPAGRQEARRAIEAASVVARIAREDGFGPA